MEPVKNFVNNILTLVKLLYVSAFLMKPEWLLDNTYVWISRL